MSAAVLCTLPLPGPGPSILGVRAAVRVLGRIPSRDDLGAALAEGVDVLCSQLRDRVDTALLDAAGTRLRAVCNYAVGYDNVDVDACSARGIAVTNTPGVLTDATADFAMALALAAARRVVEGDAEMRAGRFRGWEPEYLLGLELRGALLGLVGFGRIGQAVARRALGFGMRVAYHDSTPVTVPTDLEGRVSAMSLEDLAASADVLSLHCPLTPDTRHLVDAAMLRRMKPTAVLVNTSRGPVVDEAALVTALREGVIAAAGLDVYESEPGMAPGLAQCRNAVLAPHIASATVRTRSAMAEICARNAVAALDGTVPPQCLNPAAWPAGRGPVPR